MSTVQRFRFATDNDSHWYLIAVEKEQAFEQWLAHLTAIDNAESDEEVENLWDNYEGEEFGDNRISGPAQAFTFADPKED